ncbi:MAG TPA: hypothetical protein VIM73_11785 [Polyangiaceae bacterium]
MNRSKWLVVPSFALLLTACGDDAPTESAEEDPAEHACEHAGEQGTEVTASDTADSAPELALSDEPYTVILTPGSVGYVSLETPAEALLLAAQADVVTGLFLDGEELPLGEGAPNEFCAEDVPEHFDMDLDEAGTYTLRLGPVGVDSIWLAYVPAAGHAH